MVFRRVSVGAIPLDDLGLPPVLGQLAMEPRGLVLVTGPTGSGKTTTLAGMIDHINSNREVHVVTIEDPIEVLHFDKLSMINQREVRRSTPRTSPPPCAPRCARTPTSSSSARCATTETVKAALAAAETGHFVMSTLHTTDAQETINRIIDFFPPHEQKQVRLSLAGALRGIICQRLVPRADGQGRCASMEVCVDTGRIADAIVDPDKTNRSPSSSSKGGVLRHADLRPAPRGADPRRRHHARGGDAAVATQPARPHGRAAPPRPRRLRASGGHRPRVATGCAPRRPR